MEDKLVSGATLEKMGAKLYTDRVFYLEFPEEGYYFYSKGDERFELCERLPMGEDGYENFRFKVGITPRILETKKYTFVEKNRVTSRDAIFFSKVLREIEREEMADYILGEFLSAHEIALEMEGRGRL